jgi:hypothetical protein
MNGFEYAGLSAEWLREIYSTDQELQGVSPIVSSPAA